MSTATRQPQSIDSKILAAIHRRGRGCVFVPADFLDIGSREAVDVVLHRLTRKGTIRRLARGVYDFPEKHPVLGPLQPSADEVAQALAGRDRTRLQPAGAYAANALGLSEQVPAKVVFLTDGPTRTVKIGSTTIQLRRTTARNMAAAGRLSGLLIQALRGRHRLVAVACLSPTTGRGHLASRHAGLATANSDPPSPFGKPA